MTFCKVFSIFPYLSVVFEMIVMMQQQAYHTLTETQDPGVRVNLLVKG